MPEEPERPDWRKAVPYALLAAAVELLPWIRTFTGRIVSLKSTNAEVEKRFYGDLAAMRAMYGGDADAVQ